MRVTVTLATATLVTYFGRHYRSKTQVDAAFPNDKNAYIMEHNGEYFDGEPVEQLAK